MSLFKTYCKKILSQKNIFYNQESYEDSLKHKLELKQNQYKAAEEWGKRALKGYENESTGKSFGSSNAKSLDTLKRYYADLFEKVAFEREEFDQLNGTERWAKLKEHFENEKEMDEACLEQLIDFAQQNSAFFKRLRANMDSPLRSERDLLTAQAETQNVSVTPTSDFVDNVDQDLPNFTDYIDD